MKDTSSFHHDTSGVSRWKLTARPCTAMETKSVTHQCFVSNPFQPTPPSQFQSALLNYCAGQSSSLQKIAVFCIQYFWHAEQLNQAGRLSTAKRMKADGIGTATDALVSLGAATVNPNIQLKVFFFFAQLTNVQSKEIQTTVNVTVKLLQQEPVVETQMRKLELETWRGLCFLSRFWTRQRSYGNPAITHRTSALFGGVWIWLRDYWYLHGDGT